MKGFEIQPCFQVSTVNFLENRSEVLHMNRGHDAVKWELLG